MYPFPDRLPPDFIFGAATASFQIEGAHTEQGKGPSIWDTFCRKPGAIVDGSDGDLACDHYHRFEEDIRLMKELGLDAYRFSIAWPRIIPDGTGSVNEAGIAWYSHLIDRLREEGIEPVPTLYHWDLPQSLEDRGGWRVRETAHAFARYAEVCFRAFGDRVTTWITLNEPYCSSFLGYGIGIHAPGISDQTAMLHAIHHLNLGHGLAVARFRDGGFPGKIGTTLNLIRHKPASESPEDLLAADRTLDLQSRMFLYPLLGKGYPQRYLDTYPGHTLPIEAGDLAIIAAPMDFLGINYYMQYTVEFDPSSPEHYREAPSPEPRTAMGWPVTPEGLLELLSWVNEEAPDLPLYITENGSAWDDVVQDDDEGSLFVDDAERTDYLIRHLDVCARAVAQGIPLKGYYVWSLLDNFEWAFGYTKRFGIIHCDFTTQRRTPKRSYYAYRDAIREMRDHA